MEGRRSRSASRRRSNESQAATNPSHITTRKHKNAIEIDSEDEQTSSDSYSAMESSERNETSSSSSSEATDNDDDGSATESDNSSTPVNSNNKDNDPATKRRGRGRPPGAKNKVNKNKKTNPGPPKRRGRPPKNPGQAAGGRAAESGRGHARAKATAAEATSSSDDDEEEDEEEEDEAMSPGVKKQQSGPSRVSNASDLAKWREETISWIEERLEIERDRLEEHYAKQRALRKNNENNSSRNQSRVGDDYQVDLPTLLSLPQQHVISARAVEEHENPQSGGRNIAITAETRHLYPTRHCQDSSQWVHPPPTHSRHSHERRNSPNNPHNPLFINRPLTVSSPMNDV